MIKPLRNDLLVKLPPVKDKVTAGGIIVVHRDMGTTKQTTTRDPWMFVEDLGPQFNDSSIKVGNKILVVNGQFRVVHTADDGTEYAIVKYEDLVGVFE